MKLYTPFLVALGILVATYAAYNTEWPDTSRLPSSGRDFGDLVSSPAEETPEPPNAEEQVGEDEGVGGLTNNAFFPSLMPRVASTPRKVALAPRLPAKMARAPSAPRRVARAPRLPAKMVRGPRLPSKVARAPQAPTGVLGNVQESE